MTWTYSQKDGELLHDGVFEGTGYSGTGAGRNNSGMETKVALGPIPKGKYTIGPVRNSPRLGPNVMNLDPLPTTEVYGRSLFRIHGDNARHDASHGCIILGPTLRVLIARNSDKTLEVI